MIESSDFGRRQTATRLSPTAKGKLHHARSGTRRRQAGGCRGEEGGEGGEGEDGRGGRRREIIRRWNGGAGRRHGVLCAKC